MDPQVQSLNTNPDILLSPRMKKRRCDFPQRCFFVPSGYPQTTGKALAPIRLFMV
jgi:hypothetical protein